MAGIDSHCLALWSRDRNIFYALPLDKLAERNQEDAPVGQAHPARSVLKEFGAVFLAPESVPH